MDDALLEAPLAAICRNEGGVRRYLVQDHILEPVASVFLILGGKPRERPADLFLGVGDPIYNRADARWARRQATAAAGPGLELPRLPGSLAELERISRQLSSQGTRSQLLTGGAATPERFAIEVAARPKVIHIAAHLIQEETDQRGFVLMPGGPTDQSAVVVRRPSEMFLMLSLRPDGRADGLTARSVGAFARQSRGHERMRNRPGHASAGSRAGWVFQVLDRRGRLRGDRDFVVDSGRRLRAVRRFLCVFPAGHRTLSRSAGSTTGTPGKGRLAVTARILGRVDFCWAELKWQSSVISAGTPTGTMHKIFRRIRIRMRPQRASIRRPAARCGAGARWWKASSAGSD